MNIRTMKSLLALTALLAPIANADGSAPLKWCSEVTVTGKLSTAEYKNPLNGMSGPVYFIATDKPVQVTPSDGDCAFDAVETKNIQIAGNTGVTKEKVGTTFTVTGRLLPPGAPADIYDVILFVPF